jgi:ethanolamine permease
MAVKLVRTLGPLTLWGLGVGYVISGMYFGWNLGLAEGGTLGLAMATLFIIVLYTTFIFSYTELACAIMVGHVGPPTESSPFLPPN